MREFWEALRDLGAWAGAVALLILFAAVAMLPGCGEPPVPAAIHDAPNNWPRLAPAVRYVSAPELQQICGRDDPRRFRGCTLPDLNRGVCHVFVLDDDPRREDVLQHELTVHCAGHSCPYSGPRWGARVMEAYGMRPA